MCMKKNDHRLEIEDKKMDILPADLRKIANNNMIRNKELYKRLAHM
jgi:hypothetical protein